MCLETLSERVMMWIEQDKGTTVSIFLCLAKSGLRWGGNKQSKDFSGTKYKISKEKKTNENAQTLH